MTTTRGQKVGAVLVIGGRCRGMNHRKGELPICADARSMWNALRPVSVALGLVILLSGCDSEARRISTPLTPTATSPPAPPPGGPPTGAQRANYRGEAIVVARTGSNPCGWGTSVGETRNDVLWEITISGSSIVLDEDMRNWPTDDVRYSGTLNGVEFTASYSQGDDYLKWVCQFKGGTLTGRFSADFSMFEADETLIWGPPVSETTVYRRWVVSR
jgi:hypothetical protein